MASFLTGTNSSAAAPNGGGTAGAMIHAGISSLSKWLDAKEQAAQRLRASQPLGMGPALAPAPGPSGDMFRAIQEGSVSAVEKLLQGGKVLVNSLDANCQTPLLLAVCYKEVKIVKLLLKWKADPNLKGTQNLRWSPLQQAVLSGDAEILQLLIDAKADYNYPPLGNPDGYQRLATMVARSGNEECMRVLLKTGKVSLLEIDQGMSVLMAAIAEGNNKMEGMVKLLLKIEPRLLHLKSPHDGRTVMHVAAAQPNLPILKHLLSLLPPPESTTAQDVMGMTPLHVACSSGAPALIEALLKADASAAELKMRDGGGLLHAMAHNPRINTHCLQLVLAAKPHLADVKDSQGRVALHHAAQTDNAVFIGHLISCGAPLSPESSLGETPLWIAERCSSQQSSRLLRAAGAEMYGPSKRTPTEYSSSFSYPSSASSASSPLPVVERSASSSSITGTPASQMRSGADSPARMTSTPPPTAPPVLSHQLAEGRSSTSSDYSSSRPLATASLPIASSTRSSPLRQNPSSLPGRTIPSSTALTPPTSYSPTAPIRTPPTATLGPKPLAFSMPGPSYAERMAAAAAAKQAASTATAPPPPPTIPSSSSPSQSAGGHSSTGLQVRTWVIQPNQLEKGQVLGKGHFAKVYKGTWKTAPVAIKQTLSEDDAEFEREAELLSMIPPHPNVVQFLGICKTSEGWALVTELLQGSLGDWLKEKRQKGDMESLTLEKLLHFSRSAASGMLHLHSIPLVHRDLAARNLLIGPVSEDGFRSVKVCDFGLARVGSEYNRAELMPIRHTAPEALTSQDFSLQSDVWSFGITLWEIFAYSDTTRKTPSPPSASPSAFLWQQPYNDLNADQAGSAIKAGELLPRTSNCPEQIYRIMHMCWARNPKARPDFSQLLYELKQPPAQPQISEGVPEYRS